MLEKGKLFDFCTSYIYVKHLEAMMLQQPCNHTQTTGSYKHEAEALPPLPKLWTTTDNLQMEVDKDHFPLGPYTRGGLLGMGGWSKAYKVLERDTGCVFAGKLSEAKAKLREEAAILRSLSHDHILKFIDFCIVKENPASPLLVTELCFGGTLQAQIDQYPEAIRREEALLVTLQVAKALEYLHDKNLLHTDVKPRNILIRTWKPVDVVLADCADVKALHQITKLSGTEAFFTPQMMKSRRNHGLSDDIWALGITFMGLIRQWPPIYPIKNDVKEYPKRCLEHAQELKELNPDHDLANLLSRMLEWEPETRATASECVQLAEECLEHPSQDESDGSDFVFRTPENFIPLSFW